MDQLPSLGDAPKGRGHRIGLRDAGGRRTTTVISAPTRERAEEIARSTWKDREIIPRKTAAYAEPGATLAHPETGHPYGARGKPSG